MQIVIPAGGLSGSVTATAVQDTLDESNETVIVDIGIVTNGTETGTQQAMTTITDDDTPPSITLAVNNSTIAEAAGVATFTATLSAASGLPVTVDLGFTGTATLTDDYTRTGAQIVIAAGSTTGSITITAVQDPLDENNETVVVDINGVTNGTETGTQQTTTTITDYDAPPSVTLAVNNANIAEASGVAIFTATLSTASGLPVTVDLGFTGTVTLADDYTRSGTQIIIAAGNTTGTVTVTAVQDTLDENNETVVVDITNLTNGTETGTQQATTTITDDDAPPTVTLAVDNANIAEAAGTATFTATLSAVSGLPITIDLVLTGTATLTDDYTRTGAQIVIAAGSTTGSITVTAVQDTLDENNETVVVDITGVTNGTETGTQQATTTITDDDAPPSVTLAVNNATIAEAAGVATFTATLSAASGLPITIDLGLTGTATLTDDYTRSGTQIVIAAGNTTGTVTVTAVQDALDENDETVIVDITNVTNGTETGTQQATTTITDDDAPPTVTLAVDNANVAEAARVATFTATLSAVSGLPVTIDLGFTGTATLTDDYTRSGTQIIIAAGNTTGTVTVTAVQDALDENNETVVVDITNLTNGTETGTQQATTTITDDDAPPTVTLAVDNTNIAEAAGTATFTATLSAVSGLPVTIDLGFTGTATLTDDYTRTGAQIVIAAGSTTGSITVTAVQDTLDENNETVVVEISSVTNGTETGTQQATTTITDDDLPPTVTLAVDNSNIAEAVGVATFTATLSAASAFPVTVDVGFSGTAVLTDDFTRSGTQIVIAAGAVSGTVTVTAVQDTLDENDETVAVDIISVVNGTEATTQQATTTITDDDLPPAVTLSVEHATIAEAAGEATYTATLSVVSGLPVTIDLGFGGSASLTDDYSRSGIQIVIPAGGTAGSISVTAVQDAIDENDETVIVDILGVTNGTESGTQQAVALIGDDDIPPTVMLTVDNATIPEASAAATITATLSAVSGLPVTIDLSFSGSAALTADYTRTGTQIVIAAGSTIGTVVVTAAQDLLDENDETVVADISNVVNGTESGSQQVAITIADDDLPPTVTLSVNNSNIPEASGVATLTATLSAPSGLPVTIDLGFSGSATLANDFTRTGTQMLIAAGATTGTVQVTSVQDTIDENDETVVVEIAGATNGTMPTVQQATITIADDDLPPVVTLAVDNANIAEAAGIATFTATLSAVSGLPVTVDLGYSGIALLTGDYSRSGTQILIPAGSTAGTVSVTAVQDAIDENDESVIVGMIAVTNGTESGAQQATTTITDDDLPPTVILTIDNTDIAEASGTATITATLSAVSGLPVTVDLVVTGTATLTSDYTRSGVQLVIAAGSTSGTVTVTSVQDTLDENSETIIVEITNVANGTETGVQKVTTTITDDDLPPTVTLSVNNANIPEASGVATFTATLSAASGLPVTVDFGFTGTATLTNDYVRSAVQIVIAPGNTSGTLTVTGVQDLLDENNETVIVDITGTINGTESGLQQGSTTITDDDLSPTVTLAVNNANIAEASGLAVFTATLSAVSGLPVTVDLGFSGTGVLTNDYARSATQIVIPAGGNSGSIDVTATQDLLDENNETVLIDIIGVTNGTESAIQQATTTIVDDDLPPIVTLSVASTNIAEAGGTGTFTATLSAISGLPVTVDFSFSGTALLNNDFTRTTTQVVIAAGTTSASVDVNAVQDALDENSETVVVDISGVNNGTEAGTQQQTTTITDDDLPPTVTLSVTNASIVEAGGSAAFTATLSAVSGLPITINLGFSGTATLTDDYTRTGTQIVIPAGSLTGDVSIAAVQDAIDENDETLTAEVVAVTSGTESSSQQATATIVDDDVPPIVTLAVDTGTISEATGIAIFTATLSAASGLPVSIDLDFAGTATLSDDFTRSATQIVIPAGSITANINVTAVQDSLDENNDTVLVEITAVTNGTEAGDQQATTTILDDDLPPTVTLAADNSNIAEAAGVATFTVTLSAVSGLPVTIDLSSTGTANVVDDYLQSANQIVIAAGGVFGSVTITGIQDAIDENDETVALEITAITNGNEVGDQQATTTIADDDLPPTVTVAIDENTIDEASGTATVTATLSAVSGLPVTIDFDFSGTATLVDDYTHSATQIVIAAGSTGGTISVTATQDALDENDETVVAEVSAVTNGVMAGAPQVITTLADDDLPPTVHFDVDNLSIDEAAGVGVFTATLSAVSGLPVTIDLSLTGTAASTNDYSHSASQITIPAGSTTGTINVTAAQDDLDENNESVVVEITAIINAIEASAQEASTIIVDDDLPPTVTLAVDHANVAEAAEIVTFTVTLSAPSGLPVTIDLDFTGSAEGTRDYNRSATQVVIAAGAITGTVTVTAAQDALDENDETVIVEIANIVNGTEAGSQLATTTLIDDDIPPTVTLTVDHATISEASQATTVTATLSAASGLPVTVDLGFTGTAALTIDYTRTGTQIIIAAGSTSATVSIAAVQDTLDESDESVTAEVVAVTNGTELGNQQITTTIGDDDAPPNVTLVANNTAIVEVGGTASFTATLSAISGLPVTIDLDFTGTAIVVDDFTRSGVQIVIPIGATTASVNVIAAQDSLDEIDETVIVDIASISNGTETGTQQAATTIIDDDLPPMVTLAVDKANIAEAVGTATFTATLSTPSGLPVTIDLGFTGTATLTNDFTRSATQIVIAAGNTTGTVTVTTVQDTLDENDETVVIEITNVTNGTELGTQQTTAAIADDDVPPTVTLSLDNANIAEAAGIATFRASLSTASGLPVTIDFGITGSAALTDDYSRTANQIVIAAGDTTGTVTVTAVQDVLDENNEAVAIEIANVLNGTEAGVQQIATTIVDDDAPIVLDAQIGITGASGIAGAFRIGDTVTATWNNSSAQGSSDTISQVTIDFSQFGGNSAVPASNVGGIWTASHTIVPGNVDVQNANVVVTAADRNGQQTTTADTANAIIDNQKLVVTDPSIQLSGGTGTSGTFKIGDQVTVVWNNGAAGDANLDSISTVTVDFSQFGGLASVIATNDAGLWTAHYTIAPGSIEASNLKVTISATDNAGNTTTTPDGTNLVVDNKMPSDLELSQTQIDENSGGGTIVGVLSLPQAPVGEIFEFGLIDDADGRFQLAGTQLQVRPNADLDFEDLSVHEIRVKVNHLRG